MDAFSMVELIAEAIELSPAVQKVTITKHSIVAIRFKDRTMCEITLVKSRMDQLEAAKVLFDEGATQTDLRKIFNHGVGVKYYWLCEFDRRFPDLCILDRCRLGILSLPTLHHSRLSKLRYSGEDEIEQYLDSCIPPPTKKKRRVR